MTRSRGVIQFVLDRSLLLPAGALVALAWVNTAPAIYEHFSDAAEFLVNDVGMVFFFALAAKEVVEATMPGGALSSTRRAAMPVLAAAGGMAMPALIFILVARAASEPALERGWAIPCATDIAFSYLAAQFVLGRRHGGLPFLLLLAIADDALGLILLAIFYPTGTVRPIEFVVLLGVALGVAFALRRWQTRSFWPYVGVAGAISWMAFWRGGVHPALALVPIVPFLPHVSLTQFEHRWKHPVQLVLFAFGLVNAGVPFSEIGIGTWAVLVAILVGKPLGIVSFALGGRVLGLHLPPDLDVPDLIVIGGVAAIGFTVALFFATAAFPRGGFLAETKMGALLSISGAVMAAIMAAVLGVGRFARGET